MRERENVMRECKAMAEEEPRSGWNQVQKQVQQISQGDWRKPKLGIKREALEIRQDFTRNKALLQRWCV